MVDKLLYDIAPKKLLDQVFDVEELPEIILHDPIPYEQSSYDNFHQQCVEYLKYDIVVNIDRYLNILGFGFTFYRVTRSAYLNAEDINRKLTEDEIYHIRKMISDDIYENNKNFSNEYYLVAAIISSTARLYKRSEEYCKKIIAMGDDRGYLLYLCNYAEYCGSVCKVDVYKMLREYNCEDLKNKQYIDVIAKIAKLCWNKGYKADNFVVMGLGHDYAILHPYIYICKKQYREALMCHETLINDKILNTTDANFINILISSLCDELQSVDIATVEKQLGYIPNFPDKDMSMKYLIGMYVDLLSPETINKIFNCQALENSICPILKIYRSLSTLSFTDYDVINKYGEDGHLEAKDSFKHNVILTEEPEKFLE